MCTVITKGDEATYRNWVAGNSDGFIFNQNGGKSYMNVLHRLGCTNINKRTQVNWTTVQKVVCNMRTCIESEATKRVGQNGWEYCDVCW